MEILLTPMSPGRDAEFAEMLAEYRAAGETGVYKGHHAIAWQGYAALYELMSRMKGGGYPTPDIVPMESYLIEGDGRMLGELYIRPSLSERLEKVGGHVGYKVRPGARKRGIATAALRLALRRLHEMGVNPALVTCNDSNNASARVIEKCGGVRAENAHVDEQIERHYWAPTAP